MSKIRILLIEDNHPLRGGITAMINGQSDIFEFVQAGASGFIVKNATVTDFLGTVRSVARGGKVLPPR